MENLFNGTVIFPCSASVFQVFGLAVQVKRSNDPHRRGSSASGGGPQITPLSRRSSTRRERLRGLAQLPLLASAGAASEEIGTSRRKSSCVRLEQARLNQDASQARRLQAAARFKEQSISANMPAQVVLAPAVSEQSRSLFP